MTLVAVEGPRAPGLQTVWTVAQRTVERQLGRPVQTSAEWRAVLEAYERLRRPRPDRPAAGGPAAPSQ